MLEYKLKRQSLSFYSDVFSISDDGQFAICTQDQVAILSIRFADGMPASLDGIDAKIDRKNIFVEGSASIPTEHESFTLHLKRGPNEEYSPYCYQGLVPTNVAWSPSGSSNSRGCILAVLYANNEILLFEPLRGAVQGRWRVTTCLNQLLRDDIYRSCPEEEPEMFEKIFKKCQFTSLAWTSAISTSSYDWGCSYLFAATLSKELVCFRFDMETRQLELDFWRQLSHDGSVVEISLSPQFKNNQMLLCVNCDDNLSLYPLQAFDSDDSKVGQRLTMGSPLHSRSSKREKKRSCSKWFSTNEHVVLVTAYTNELLVHVISLEQPDTVLYESIQTGILATISGIHCSKNVITLVSCEGDLFSAVFRVGEQLELETWSLGDNFVNFISKRRKREGFDMRCYGVWENETICSVLFSFVPADCLRYPLLAESVVRVAVLPSGEISSCKTTLSTMRHGPSLLWLNLLCRLGDQDTKHGCDAHSFMSSILNSESLKISVITEDSIIDSLRKTLFSKEADEARFQRLTTDKHVDFQLLLAETILSYFAVKDSSSHSHLDRCVLASFNTVFKGSLIDEAPEFQISTAAGNEYFDLAANKDKGFIESALHHRWKRCAITLLPLTNTQVQTCGGCGRKIIDKNDPIIGSGDVLVHSLLNTLDICIFCGERFYGP